MTAAPRPLYSPSPVQVEFHLTTANEALLGGAAGPGKSLSLLMDPIQTQLAVEHERWMRREIRSSEGWAIHFRREFPMLEQTIERSHRMFPVIDPGARYDSQRHMWTFSCGYKFQFGHMKNEEDRFNYNSNQYTHIAYDEMTQFTQEQYEYVNTRLRSSDPELRKRLRIRSATNPDGNWVRSYFVEEAREGRKLLSRRIRMDDGTYETRTRIFIPATLKDNPDADYRRQYEIELQDKPAHIRLALLTGDWYVVAGAFFAEEWVPSVHVVKPFKIPSGWYRFRSADWGYKAPTVIHWWAVDQDDNMVAYRELVVRKKDADELADIVEKIERDAGEWDENKRCSRLTGPIDYQIFEERGTVGPTIAETMSARGIWWEKATKNRLQSVQQIMSRLKDRSGEGGIPAIRFFDTCREAIRTIPAMGTDSTNAELPEDGGDDHAFDSVRYACMYRMLKTTSDEAPARRHPKDELEERRTKRRTAWGAYGYKRNYT